MSRRETPTRGLLFVISAPSGAGKTSLVNELLSRDVDLAVSVSHTTRGMRDGERHGIEYNFVTREDFEDMVARGVFLEHAEVYGNLYGTSADWVEARLAEGQDLILEIDWQGAAQIRGRYPEVHDIFILPPDYETLRHRLSARGKDGDDVIARRLAEARVDVAHHGDFRYLLVNDDFHHALADLMAIVRAARLGTDRQRERLAEAIASFPRD